MKKVSVLAALTAIMLTLNACSGGGYRPLTFLKV